MFHYGKLLPPRAAVLLDEDEDGFDLEDVKAIQVNFKPAYEWQIIAYFCAGFERQIQSAKLYFYYSAKILPNYQI